MKELRPGTWKFGFLVENYPYSLLPRSKLDDPGQNTSNNIFQLVVFYHLVLPPSCLFINRFIGLDICVRHVSVDSLPGWKRWIILIIRFHPSHQDYQDETSFSIVFQRLCLFFTIFCCISSRPHVLFCGCPGEYESRDLQLSSGKQSIPRLPRIKRCTAGLRCL